MAHRNYLVFTDLNTTENICIAENSPVLGRGLGGRSLPLGKKRAVINLMYRLPDDVLRVLDRARSIRSFKVNPAATSRL